MKFWCFLFLAIFASCEAITTLEKIAKQTHARLISNVPVRRAFSAKINTKEGDADTTTTTTTTTEKPETCEKERFKCKNDKLIFCDASGGTVVEACGNIFPSKVGYCNCDGSDCLASPPTNCPIPPPSAKCDIDGVLTPSPTNCKLFSYCDVTDLVYYQCEDNLIYNPKLKQCTTGTCSTVRCPTTASIRPVYVPFPQDANWYLYCYKGQPTVGKCTDGLSAISTGCTFICTGAGRFADPKDKNSYYSCSGSSPNYKKTLNKCPEGKVFDKVLKVCKTGQ